MDNEYKPISEEEKYFRWGYVFLVALAKRILKERNEELKDPDEWPAGQEWEDLNGSSKASFLRHARDEAGISHDEFLAVVRSGQFHVDDIFGE